MERRKYYTNGTNEKRLYSYETIPQGYYPGRLKVLSQQKINISLMMERWRNSLIRLI